MVAAMRLVLALAGLAVILIDPAEPDRFAPLTYAVLVAYSLYGGSLYWSSLRAGGLAWLAGASHWVDVGWYTMLIALSSGTNSVFFFGYFFAVLVAAIRRGRVAGLQVSMVSAVLYGTVGYATLPSDALLEINRFALRPIFLLVLGYMIAALAGLETAARRRLHLLQDAAAVANPRFGVERTITELMDRVRDFYDADLCLLLTSAPEAAGGGLLRHCVGRARHDATALHAPGELARQLMAPPADVALISMTGARWQRHRRERLARDLATGQAVEVPATVFSALEATLDPLGFVSVPVRIPEHVAGRVYIASRRRTFRASDIDLLAQLFRQLLPVLENIRLIDRLASDAADAERQRIARDIHDSVIQSYIGVQLGLSGLHQQAAAGHDVLPAIGRLQGVLDAGIAELRRYVSGLRTGGGSSDALAGSLRRFVSKFEYATGIAVHLEIDPGLRLSGELTAAAFRIVEEGLSNVRRHTVATQAAVRVGVDEHRLSIRVENAGAGETAVAPFTPGSIAERAVALGGRVEVERRSDGGTTVGVDIPFDGHRIT